MRIGFTGARDGMTLAQRAALVELLRSLEPSSFAHGDCVGADAQSHDIVLAELPLCHIHIYPPDKDEARAFKGLAGGALIREYPPAPYLKRNHAIVDSCDLLIAAPRTAAEQLRSGTWATIRYARKRGTKVSII